MSLDLDKRGRAMLHEMGVPFWWPPSEPTAAAPQAGAAPSPPAPRVAPALAPAVRAAAPAPAPVPVPRPGPAAPAADQAEPVGAAWHVGPVQPLAGSADPVAQAGPRWLLLAEGPPEAMSDGAGQLLRHMLRAARLHQGAQVWLAPLQRSPGPAQVQGLEPVLERTEPDVVFIMGRLGAQALLETEEPLGRLRGQVHDLWGLPAVVSYDLGALMRTPMEKAKAWDDLCLALQVAQAQHTERLQAG